MLAGKRYKSVMMSVLIVLAAVAGHEARGQTSQPSTWGQQEMLATGRHWLSQDLHLTTGTLLSSKVAPGQHLLLCQEGFTMTVGGRQYTSKRGLVWIARGGSNQGYQIQVYLADRVSSGKGGDGQDVGLTETVLERGQAVVIKTSISGEVFVTADTSDAANPRKRAFVQRGDVRLRQGRPGFAAGARAAGPARRGQDRRGRAEQARRRLYDQHRPPHGRDAEVRADRAGGWAGGHHLHRQDVCLVGAASQREDGAVGADGDRGG